MRATLIIIDREKSAALYSFYERHDKNTTRSRAHPPDQTHRRADHDPRAPEGRESRAARPARVARRGACRAHAQERAGAHARRGDDRPAEDPGARGVSHQDQARVSVRIMEREYVVACPYDERSALLDAAEFLNSRMREIRDSGKVVGLDRIAVMAALNLAHEFLRIRDRESRVDGGIGVRVRALRERVEGVLGKGQQLEL